MKALIVNCSPVKTGATAEIASIIEKEFPLDMILNVYA